jgi:adenylate cyclase
MSAEGFKRKITAIMSSDVVGYSRLMGDDEATTVKTLEAYKSVMSALIDQHHGRVIDSPGDNMLSEFASVVDAVQCAVAIQKELNSRNAELPENRKMRFRIGINLGDVIQEEDRIYGDGVNIAARLEALADPGGICVSKTAFDHIETKLPLGYEFLGEQEVKNIAKPVGAYRVLMEPRVTVVGSVQEKKSASSHQKKITIGAALFLAVALVAGIWQFYMRRPSVEPASVEKMAYPLPEKPSIAVLPFVNISGDPEQDYFSDGLTEEIITALSKVPKLFVIARNSVFFYKGKPIKVNQVAEELGVRYVLEGSIRKAGDNIRITAQLVDALSGHHLWAERYDRNLNDIFAVQDNLTKNIITSMQVKLTEGEQIRLLSKGTENLQAYLKLLQAHEKWLLMNNESNILARKLAEETIALDPDYANAYGMLAATYIMDVHLGSSKSPKDSLDQAIALNKKSLALNESYANAHGQLGILYAMTRQYNKSVAEAERGVELDPNSAIAHDLLGMCLSYAGRHDEAIPMYKKAIRLEPLAAGKYYRDLGMSYLFMGHCNEAIAACEEALRRTSNHLFAHLIATAAYSMCGKEETAQETAAEVLRIAPKFSVDHFSKRLFYKNQADVDRYIPGSGHKTEMIILTNSCKHSF